MKRLEQQGSKLVEVEVDDDLNKELNRRQDEAEDKDKNVLVDASSLRDRKKPQD